MNENMIYGLGNPLLDILATVDIELVRKYNLKENDAILAAETHMPIYEELVNNYQVQYIPGGATQNAIKVAQWILKKKFACTFSGCVKDDRYGAILKESCESIGVRVLYQYNEGPESTGVCAGLITGHHRSLVTNLGSSAKFTADFLDRPDIWRFVEQARCFYISSFFITSSHESLLKIARHSLDTGKTFCLNLGAEFLVQFFTSQVIEAIEYSDFVFGNEAEALQLAAVCGFGTTSIVEIAERIARMPYHKATAVNAAGQTGVMRTVVISQGADPIVVVSSSSGGVAKLYPVAPLTDNLIVDTTGAGDSFVGGFLAQLVQGRSIDECVRCGVWAAKIIIQRTGCTFPEEGDEDCSFQ